MKRDMDLYRAILLEVERWPPNHRRRPVHLDGWDQDVIDRHIQLLEEQGLLEASLLNLPEHGHLDKAYVQRITAWGHDFLDNIRDDGVWQRVKRSLVKSGGAASLEIVSQLGAAIVRDQLGLD